MRHPAADEKRPSDAAMAVSQPPGLGFGGSWSSFGGASEEVPTPPTTPSLPPPPPGAAPPSLESLRRQLDSPAPGGGGGKEGVVGGVGWSSDCPPKLDQLPPKPRPGGCDTAMAAAVGRFCGSPGAARPVGNLALPMLSLGAGALIDVGACAAVYNCSARSRRTPIATQTLSNRPQRCRC